MMRSLAFATAPPVAGVVAAPRPSGLVALLNVACPGVLAGVLGGAAGGDRNTAGAADADDTDREPDGGGAVAARLTGDGDPCFLTSRSVVVVAVAAVLGLAP